MESRHWRAWPPLDSATATARLQGAEVLYDVVDPRDVYAAVEAGVFAALSTACAPPAPGI